ncbi:MAG: hypothetical protein IKG01_14825 [Lachnospiraceae bacterium]|nr:hypothetical protein [Lachnospiraceae bacterium]
MDNIIRGTTPTLKYTFRTVDPTTFSVAYLTVTNGRQTIEKDLSSATIEENAISWKFSQEETLSLGDRITAMLNWKLPDGTRGASHKANLLTEHNLKEVVI